MKLMNEQGQAVYYNYVEKHGRVRVVILAASGQMLRSRDKASVKSRTFAQERQAETWCRRNGYTRSV